MESFLYVCFSLCTRFDPIINRSDTFPFSLDSQRCRQYFLPFSHHLTSPHQCCNMGQDQSKVIDSPVPDPIREDSSSPPSMESLLAEATAFGNEDENASLEAKAQKALECPCIKDLRSGPCGSQFSEAFLCFMKSNAEEKGSDCVHPFVALQKCIQTNPNAFPNDVMDNDEAKAQEKPVQDYNINAPRWAREPKNPKPKL